MLEISNVDAYYGNSHALQDVSLQVESGQFLSVLGRNGVGKTTLLRTIMGLMDRRSGSIRSMARILRRPPTDERARPVSATCRRGAIFPKFTVARTCGSACSPPRPKPRRPSTKSSSISSQCSRNTSPTRRQSLRRPAAAARHRPRADDRSEDNAAGRAHRGHSAEHRRGDRRHHRAPEPPARHHRHSGRANVAFARRASQRFIIMEKGRIAAEGRSAN